jgi:hypothetical protein
MTRAAPLPDNRPMTDAIVGSGAAARLRVAAAIDTAAWDRLRAADPWATVFHHPGWLAALTEAWPYYRLEWLIAEQEGELRGAMPTIVSRRYGVDQRLSLPYGAPGAPLADDDATRRNLLAAWWEAAHAPRVVRAHATFLAPPGGPGLPDWPGSAATRPEETRLLDLRPGFDHAWSAMFEAGVRWSCAKAERENVTVVAGHHGTAILDLDTLYREQAADWRNHTVFPEAFLAAVARRLPDNALVLRALVDDRAVGAQLILFDHQMAWAFIAPTTPEGRKRCAPSLLYRHAIEAMAARGIPWFNFGGSRGQKTLEEFKASLGGRPHAGSECLVEAAWFRPLHRLQYRLRGIRE